MLYLMSQQITGLYLVLKAMMPDVWLCLELYISTPHLHGAASKAQCHAQWPPACFGADALSNATWQLYTSRVSLPFSASKQDHRSIVGTSRASVMLAVRNDVDCETNHRGSCRLGRLNQEASYIEQVKL